MRTENLNVTSMDFKNYTFYSNMIDYKLNFKHLKKKLAKYFTVVKNYIYFQINSNLCNMAHFWSLSSLTVALIVV